MWKVGVNICTGMVDGKGFKFLSLLTQPFVFAVNQLQILCGV